MSSPWVLQMIMQYWKELLWSYIQNKRKNYKVMQQEYQNYEQEEQFGIRTSSSRTDNVLFSKQNNWKDIEQRI